MKKCQPCYHMNRRYASIYCVALEQRKIQFLLHRLLTSSIPGDPASILTIR